MKRSSLLALSFLLVGIASGQAADGQNPAPVVSPGAAAAEGMANPGVTGLHYNGFRGNGFRGNGFRGNGTSLGVSTEFGAFALREVVLPSGEALEVRPATAK